MSLGNYDIDAVRNSATFKSAISETMPGVVSSDIRNFDVIAGSFKDSSLPADFIILHYDVDVPSKLWQVLLSDAVADGSFDNYLRAAAISSGATNLEGATGGTIATHTIEDDNTKQHPLSLAAIIGMAVGVFLALALAATLLYYFGCCGCWGLGGARGKRQTAPAEEDCYADQV